MDYNKLTPEEEKAFVNKATEVPFEGDTAIFMEMGHISVKGVILLPFHQKASLIQDVDGQSLMKTCQMQ